MNLFLPVLLLLSILAMRIEAADLLFDSWRVYPVGEEPRAACFADFDGDGDIDVAVASRHSEEVTVLLNAGDGTFDETFSYWVAEETWAIDAADLDHDGDIDLVVGVTHDVASAAILKNRGDGTFLLPSYFGVHGRCSSVCIADFNGDSHPDIAGAFADYHEALIMFNYGDGVFTYPLTVETGYEPRCVAASDLDDDGDMDLVVVERGGDDVFVCKNRGDGRFDPGVRYPLALDPSFALVADLNGDGYDDLVVNMERSTSLAIYINDGGGDFSSPVLYEVGQYCMAFDAGDIDKDDDQDIIACRSNREFSILYNEGQAIFSDTIMYNQYYRAAYFVDVNEDGTEELVGLSNGAMLEVLPNKEGNFSELPFYGPESIYNVAVADFNGDGHIDLAGSMNNRDSIVLLLNSGMGEFSPEQLPITGDMPRIVIAADIEGDHDMDLLVENERQDEILIMLNDGTGLLVESGSALLPDDPYDIEADDLDGDGDIDLACIIAGEYSHDSIYIMHYIENGVYEHQYNLGKEPGYRDICTADFGGDGSIDLAASYYGGIAIFFNAGGGFFDSSIVYPIESTSPIIDAADYDNDGDIDIVAAKYYVGDTWILSNNGDGTFQMVVGRSTEGRLIEMQLADIEGDGDQDFIGANWDGYHFNMAIMINEGNSFLPAQYYGGCGRAFTLADLDNDGDIDVASAVNGISILFNQSDILADADDAEIIDVNVPEWHLSQNFPNPFNPSTQIAYTIPRRSHVTLAIYNTLGQRVVTLIDAWQTAGAHKIQWDGRDKNGHMVSSGIYLYQLLFDKVVDTKKMIMLK